MPPIDRNANTLYAFNNFDSIKEYTMKEGKTIEILKMSVILERQGKAFYEQAAKQSSGAAVKELFSTFAAEEEKHIAFLIKELGNYAKEGEFVSLDFTSVKDGFAKAVISGQIRKEIHAATYEAAAISAAIDMENKAVKLYSDRAAETTDLQEKKLYEWLSRWEQGHASLLAEINKGLLEDYWNNNSYWPF